jgi:hypothetical protein
MDRLAQRLLRNPAAGPDRPHSRLGCLGCLPRLILILFGGIVLVGLITAVFAPWGFFMGGKFNLFAYWQGWGTLNSKNGKYIMYVRFYPSRSGSRIYPHPSVKGLGYVCSPRGQVFNMHLGGGMRRGIGTNTDGENIDLYMYYWPALWGTFVGDHRPSIEVRGQWKNPTIIGDDHGSISRAFKPDGTVYQRGEDAHVRYPGDIVPVTLVPGSYSDFQSACKANH